MKETDKIDSLQLFIWESFCLGNHPIYDLNTKTEDGR